MGILRKNTGRSVEFVSEFVKRCKLYNVSVELLSADSGVNPQSMFQIMTSDVEKYLCDCGIKSERAEPYNHSRGTPVVERSIRMIKELIRLAVMYVTTNPNFKSFGFAHVDILKLWGELFYWSIAVINLKPCPGDERITRYEAFHGKRPNMQNIRILPIFAALLVYRDGNKNSSIGEVEIDSSNVVSSSTVKSVPVYSTNQPESKFGLYIGPSLSTPGSIRAAVMYHGKVKVYTSSKFSAVSDGGGINIHKDVMNGTVNLLNNSSNEVVKDVPVVVRGGNNGIVVNDVNGNDVVVSADDHVVAVNNDVVNSNVSDSVAVGDGVVDAVVVRDNVIVNDDVCDGVNNEKVFDFEPAVLAKSGKRKSKRKKKKSKATGVVTFGADSVIENNVVVEDVDDVDDIVDDVRGNVSPAVDPYAKVFAKTSKSRAQRVESRQDRKNQLSGIANTCYEVETACLADWSTYRDNDLYWSWGDMAFVEIGDACPNIADVVFEDGFRAVTEDVPPSFKKALVHPKWGGPARKEWDTIVSATALVQTDREVAIDCIKNHNSDLVILFPVYECKVKDGVVVYKVRLVGDGRTQYRAGATYAATPSREELLIILHIAAVFGWPYVHVDEIRAFLNAKRSGTDRVFAKFRGDSRYFEILGALYGLKTLGWWPSG